MPYMKTMKRKDRITSRAINNLLSLKAKVRIAYRCHKSSAHLPNKDRMPEDLRSNIIYQYVCDQCSGHTYTGETKRHFCVRRREHLLGKPDLTEVSLHHHELKAENFKVAHRTKYTFIAEALIYLTVPPQYRLNKYAPPFKLQLFDIASHPSTSSESNCDN